MFQKLREFKLKYNKEKNLILRLNNELKKLKKLSGDRKKIILESKQILVIIKQLEKTEIYWFVKEDVEKVRNYLIKVKENPKNKGLVYLLAGIYIVAPGTFELTGIVLFFRYSWRYIKKTL